MGTIAGINMGQTALDAYNRVGGKDPGTLVKASEAGAGARPSSAPTSTETRFPFQGRLCPAEYADGQAVAQDTQITILVASITAAPEPGDTIEMGGETYKVSRVEEGSISYLVSTQAA